MPEQDLAAPATADTTPAAPPPVMSQAEIEALVERKATEKANEFADKRIAGLMSSNDKKVAALEAKLAKLTRSFSNEEDDEPDPRLAELEAELARVQREAAEAEAARLYPDVYDDFKALTGRETPADQLAYLRELRQKLAAPQSTETPASAVEPPSPPIDPNQPARNEPAFGADAETMSDEQAWDILGKFKWMPGSGH